MIGMVIDRPLHNKYVGREPVNDFAEFVVVALSTMACPFTWPAYAGVAPNISQAFFASATRTGAGVGGHAPLFM